MSLLRNLFKQTLWALEALGILAFYGLIKCIPLDKATAFCGSLAQKIGPKLKVSNVARSNLKEAFPKKSDLEIEEIVKETWNTLGRVVAEFPHMDQILLNPSRIKTHNFELVESLYLQKKSVIFFAAHLGNWELSHASIVQAGMPINLIARVHHNHFVESFIRKVRSSPLINMIGRNKAGTRELIHVIQNGEFVGALLDQHSSDGVMLPFFARPARTTISLAKMAIKFDVPFVPVQVKRIPGTSRFEIIFHAPLEILKSGDIQKDAENLMNKANLCIESWIRENPGQWLWLHRRWKNKKTLTNFQTVDR